MKTQHDRLTLALLVPLLAACAVMPAASLSPGAGPTQSAAGIGRSLPRCDDVPYLEAPAESYRSTPIYVANEMEDLIARIQPWAAGQPGFAGLWIDRDHHGWVSVAFTTQADQRQADLLSMFPQDGVVAVPVEWTEDELRAIQGRIVDEFFRQRHIEISSGVLVNRGVATIGMAVLRPEWVALAEELFGGEPVCLSGLDPADAPPDGPQAPGGDGWRLLANADNTGPAYRTGIAFDDDSYARLWTNARVSGDRPAVDFESEVVIWFGAVTGSSCPELRLDDVVVDSERRLVYADIVNLTGALGCTDDIHPHAYVVALLRELLPSRGFSIQLNSSGPPRGAPEERTVVDADLSVPGSIAQSGEIHGDANLPEPYFVTPGGFIEPGFEAEYKQSTHCGLEWLGPLNDVGWRTDAAQGSVAGIPTDWLDEIDEGETITLLVLIETGDVPTLTATAGDYSVVYTASPDDPPGCD